MSENMVRGNSVSKISNASGLNILHFSREKELKHIQKTSLNLRKKMYKELFLPWSKRRQMMIRNPPTKPKILNVQCITEPYIRTCKNIEVCRNIKKYIYMYTGIEIWGDR